MLFFLRKQYDVIDCVMYLLGGKLLNGAMWYIVALLIILVALYIFDKIVPSSDYIAKCVVAVCVYILLWYLYGGEPHQIQSCSAFVLGGVVQKYETSLSARSINRRKWIWSCGWGTGIFLISFSSVYVFERILGADYAIIRFIMGTISSCSFVLLMLLFIQKVELDNYILRLLGEVSTEIYLVHILVINLFKYYVPNLFGMSNAIMVSCLIVVSTIGISLVIRYVRNVLFRSK